MTRIELIKSNKKDYAEYLEKIKSMKGIKKAVAENFILEWLKGNNWIGGLSDSKYQKILDKLIELGYDENEIVKEFEYQLDTFEI